MEIPRNWRLRAERLRFELGFSCGMCGAIYTQDRPVCPECGLNYDSGKFVGALGEQFITLMSEVLYALTKAELGDEDVGIDEWFATATIGNQDRLVEALAMKLCGV